MRPYEDADFLTWVQVGQRFKCKTREEAIERIDRNGYVICPTVRLVVIGEGD